MDLSAFFDQYAVFNENVLLSRIVIVCVYAILAKGVDIFIDRILGNLAAKTKIAIDDKIINFLHGPICWSIFWLGVLRALTFEPLHDPWGTILPQIAQSVIVIIWLLY